ncbi:MAG: nucleoside hydrolase-like domain-containing protein [Opitutaceae bacterium]
MKTLRHLLLLVLAFSAVSLFAADASRRRVMVSTDIGGTDDDDSQSMAHLLVYADAMDLEGLISSPYGPGRKRHLLEVIEAYAEDYPTLKTYSNLYPTPDQLRFSPKAAKTWSYTIHSDRPGIDGKTGGLTSVYGPATGNAQAWSRTPNWWTDNPAPELREGSQQGAKTISRWRSEFLRDFATRMERLAPSKP